MRTFHTVSATLKALNCREIFEEVFDKLSPGPQLDDEDCLPELRVQCHLAQGTIARAARVCRSFEDPALNVLWRVVDSIPDLLRILPSYSVYPYTFTRDITEPEWARFRKYLIRVRDLNAEDHECIEAFTWTVLRRWCPQGPFLPLLERLSGFELDDMGISHTMLLTPMLHHVSMALWLHPSEATVRMVMGEMMPVLSQIRSLAVSGHADRLHLIPIWSLVQLRSLKIAYSITPTVTSLNSLASFPFLRDLSLNLTAMEELAAIPLKSGFQALRHLELSAIGLTHVVIFLEITKPPRLHSFKLSCRKFLADTDIESVLSQLDTIHSWLPSSLLQFSTEFHVAREGLNFMSSGGPTAAQLLAPLRSRTDMHTISFTFEDMYVGLTKEDLNSVQTLWPSLTTFEFAFGETIIYDLVFTYGGQYSGFPSLASVAAFVSAHPQLERLAIPSISLALGGIDLDSLPSLPNPRLRRLRVPFFLPSIYIVKLGLLVDRLYPNLDLTDIGSTLDTGYQRGQQFDLLLCGLQAGRRGAYMLDGARMNDLGML
ncbi:hypothetical protein L227DRAFT_62324 [Lentinus tigrinus ALCF2SS1-6]|uniref:F-box domain-containing protein n=1 Tax=Lentinus tigrinus ALCF2SS1-6 TaxID=1328759 RepID=A0A5C2RP75_9APHY|nr:hypothetical protein L227DRAFT_62324 [Lentinus tigrinus ALCF2SS1-6]